MKRRTCRVVAPGDTMKLDKRLDIQAGGPRLHVQTWSATMTEPPSRGSQMPLVIVAGYRLGANRSPEVTDGHLALV